MVAVSDHLSSLLWRQAVRVTINTFVEVMNIISVTISLKVNISLSRPNKFARPDNWGRK